jgi:Cys-rich repeat protein
MIDRWLELSERLTAEAGITRRGFVGWLGRGAAVAVATAAGFLAATADAKPRGCTSNDDCPEGQFCARHHGCGTPGNCAPRPDFCIQVYEPVCGCDGHTYSNACIAAKNGVNVQHQGPCRRRR